MCNEVIDLKKYRKELAEYVELYEFQKSIDREIVHYTDPTDTARLETLNKASSDAFQRKSYLLNEIMDTLEILNYIK